MLTTLSELQANCTFVKGAKAEAKIYSYEYGDNATALWNVYGRCSYAKQNAYEYCLDLMSKLHGWGGCICSHNIFQFTYAFICRTEEKRYLVFITRDYNFFMEYPEE